MSPSATQRYPAVAAELAARGPDVLEPLPSPAELKDLPDAERHEVLQVLRVELYALASLLSDAAVHRARRERPNYPPYGLARSMHSESRLLVANPLPVAEGSIDSFVSLGKAFLDTMVFHLDRALKDQLQSDQRWQVDRVEELLALFRIGAGPASRARMRNALSFIYGGLQFGVSVCVQLAEVMSRLLEDHPGLYPADKATIMEHSLRPAYRLAALNVDEVIPAYQCLVSPESGAWMDAGRFVVRESDGRGLRIELTDEALVSPRPQGPPLVWATQGCPARASHTGEGSAIATLWRWCVRLAHDLQLLGPA